MRKKFLAVVLLVILILFAGFYIVKNHFMVYVYTNPSTNTDGCKYIAKTIRILNKGFDHAKYSARKEGANIKYLYQNAYGSGFINNNPIPNDLDYAIGIDLGEYEYDGKNGKELAEKLVNDMNTYEFSFVYFINTLSKDKIYTVDDPMSYYFNLMKISRMQKKTITNTLDLAIKGDNYVQHTKKDTNGNHSENGIDVPYIMRSGEILLEDRHPIKMYSSVVNYNKQMPHYMREITVIPEYFATLKQGDKKCTIAFVPESALGERLQLARRFYVSQIFIHNYSANYLKKCPLLQDNDEYIFYRLFSYRRHLQAINNHIVLRNKPIKIYKRLLQTADIIYPAISDKDYKEVYDYVALNLYKPEIKLLNEYYNIATNLIDITKHTNLCFKLIASGDIKIMCDTLKQTIDTLEKMKSIKQEDIAILKNLYKTHISKALDIKTEKDMKEFYEAFEKGEYTDSWTRIIEMVYSVIEQEEKNEKFVNLFNQIYLDAGYHSLSLYWLDNDTIGIISDDFTKNINDYKTFAKDNNLVDANYKLISEAQAPLITMRYNVFAKYNPTEKEIENHKKLTDILLKDKTNFSIKKKYVFY